LNLGCGDENLNLYVNADIEKAVGVDILLDLDSPLPIKSNSIGEVRVAGVIAHIKHPLRLRKEIDRILKEGGKAYICSCTCDSLHRHNVGGFYRKI
jgi:SAM-dependent methyltransferase